MKLDLGDALRFGPILIEITIEGLGIRPLDKLQKVRDGLISSINDSLGDGLWNDVWCYSRGVYEA